MQPFLLERSPVLMYQEFMLIIQKFIDYINNIMMCPFPIIQEFHACLSHIFQRRHLQQSVKAGELLF